TLPLLNDFDRQRVVGVTRIDEVVTAVHPRDVDGIGVEPVTRPVIRPRIQELEPIALILEARVPAGVFKRQAVDPEAVSVAEVGAIPVVGNAVTTVSAALLPTAVFRLPVLRAMLLPYGGVPAL